MGERGEHRPVGIFPDSIEQTTRDRMDFLLERLTELKQVREADPKDASVLQEIAEVKTELGILSQQLPSAALPRQFDRPHATPTLSRIAEAERQIGEATAEALRRGAIEPPEDTLEDLEQRAAHDLGAPVSQKEIKRVDDARLEHARRVEAKRKKHAQTVGHKLGQFAHPAPPAEQLPRAEKPETMAVPKAPPVLKTLEQEFNYAVRTRNVYHWFKKEELHLAEDELQDEAAFFFSYNAILERITRTDATLGQTHGEAGASRYFAIRFRFEEFERNFIPAYNQLIGEIRRHIASEKFREAKKSISSLVMFLDEEGYTLLSIRQDLQHTLQEFRKR